MAIFWNHIKGTGNASSNSNGLWTWIEWSKETELVPDNGPYREDYSGEILVSNSNGSPGDAKSLGKILTTNIDATTRGDWGNYGSWTWYDTDGESVFELTPDLELCKITTQHPVQWTVNTLSFLNGTTQFLSINSSEKTWTSTLNINNTGIIKTTDKCEASYFNAISDKRAKENITPATFSGLNFINKLSVYTFNYKDKTDVVPGILAQDLLEVQPEGLDLVDNITATGENGDYMSIKEGKLVFVLMQAIKEQQAQIDELKAELKKLTK